MAMNYPSDLDSFMRFDTNDHEVQEVFDMNNLEYPLEAYLVKSLPINNIEVQNCEKCLEAAMLTSTKPTIENLTLSFTWPLPSIEKPPKLELKLLPSYLRYMFLGDDSTLLVIISVKLKKMKKRSYLEFLEGIKRLLGG